MVRLPEPGTRITIVKLSPDGQPVARYQGTVLPGRTGWVVAEARWTYREVESGPLRFTPGDRLIEYFSLVEPISAFAVFSAEGHFKGWYANVSCPLDIDGEEVRWRDLYIDVIAVPGTDVTIRDEDELEAGNMAEAQPDGYRCILATRDRLLEMIRGHEYPFSEA
uniref:DUF402 domain-containing protein n=1 Tax=Thermorudis peleae TaxID=1382356 RepID=A0A831THR7_9BACT